jgi:hypothetical protein
MPTVYIKKTEKGYQLIRNGKPFFIKGGCGNSFFADLKEAGGNTIRIYDSTNLKRKLDIADSLDIAVIVDIQLPRFSDKDTIYGNKDAMHNLYEDTKRFVNNYKDHPALLFWMLGNEIKYPDLPGDKDLRKNFNALIDLIHKEDGNHPVSTAVTNFDRRRILSIITLSRSLDLISINIFGDLKTFNERKKNMQLLWNGPYIFSEFGINGPWESKNTKWHVPLEETSTKKAEQYKSRYNNFVKEIDDGRLLGSLAFYWGHKQETTHTWFSTFSPMGKKTQAVFEMENIWKGKNKKFVGPKIDYLLLDGRRAHESIILAPNEQVAAKLVLLNKYDSIKSYRAHWEILPESWNYVAYDDEEKPAEILGLALSSKTTDFQFITPQDEGPYRLCVTVEGRNGYLATANVPYYIFDHKNGK